MKKQTKQPPICIYLRPFAWIRGQNFCSPPPPGGSASSRLRASLLLRNQNESRQLIVPAIVRYEVGRYVLAHSGEVAREMAIRAMAKFAQVAVDAAVADEASRLAAKHKMAMADALIYAVARAHEAELWTQDGHFENLPGVRFFKK